MSTQDAEAGTPVSILPDGSLQHVRLFELPSELLALVTAEHPPTLQLKSNENIDGSAKDANAVLCTPDKTYNIRQVSTSNTVYLTRSAELPDDGGGPPRPILEVVSKCDSTLELSPAAKQSAVPYIKTALPTFASTGSYGPSKNISKTELYSHIPLSQAECEQGWLDLACFESIDPAGCFIPSAKVRAQILQTALTVAMAEGADPQDPFLPGDVPAFGMDLKDDWPFALLTAIFASISVPSPGENLVIDAGKCVRAVGLSLLESRSGGRPTSLPEFLKSWRDALPEAWRTMCEVSNLQDFYRLQDEGTYIVFVDGTSTDEQVASNAVADAKSTLGAKRKWHEKFRPSKKA